MRKQRAEDPELRAREAKAKRERMATKPESKARQVEAQRRYEDAHREERKEAKRRRRNADPGLRVLEAVQCRRRGSSFDEEVGPNCGRLCFDNSLSRLSSVRNEEQHLCVSSSTSVADLSVCKTCKDSLLSGTMPPLSKMTLAASAALSSMDTDVFCSQSTQASITTSSIGIQCAVGFLISSSSQTYEECPAPQEPQQSPAVGRSPPWQNPWTLLAQTMEGLEKPTSTSGLEADGTPAVSSGSAAHITCSCRTQSGCTGETIENGGARHPCLSCRQHSQQTGRVTARALSERTCPVCEKVFSSKWNRDSHLRVHSGEKPFVCGMCQKGFGNRSCLTRHEKVHSGERPHVCGVCQKSFANRTNLISHEKLHSGHRPYVCGTCQRSFARRGHLVMHERVHSGERPYMCSSCQKSFSQNSELIYHERVHSGERPFVCGDCHKGFTRRNHLVEHERNLHSCEKPYVCGTCQKGFPKGSQLVVHERMHALCQGVQHV